VSDLVNHRDGKDTSRMQTLAKSLLLLATTLLLCAIPQSKPSTHASQFTNDGKLKAPEDYRTWIYLSTGFDMSYTAGARKPEHHMFDNVFVPQESYAVFLKTGTWPEGTMLALEGREGKSKGSINHDGNFQSTEVMGFEVHVKDSKRFANGWAFFRFSGEGKPGVMIPTTADCYSCHGQHAAVDTTFVQFYPTLLPIAKIKGTLSANYKKETE
jgi:hypothetical protein